MTNKQLLVAVLCALFDLVVVLILALIIAAPPAL